MLLRFSPSPTQLSDQQTNSINGKKEMEHTKKAKEQEQTDI